MTINKRRKKYPVQNINYFNGQRITKKNMALYNTAAKHYSSYDVQAQR